MLAKINRLHTDQDIKRLIQTGKTFFLPQFTIKVLKTIEPEVKFGFVVSTKVDKKATTRNLLKRRMREAVRSMLPGIKSGYSLLIIAKKSALGLSFKDIKSQFAFAFSTLKIYNNKQT